MNIIKDESSPKGSHPTSSQDDSPVVVTGVGVVTPIGIGKENFWEGLMNGRSGVGPLCAFDSSGLAVNRAYEVRDFDPSLHLPKRINHLGRTTQLAMVATLEALDDSHLDISQLDSDRIGLCLGTIGGELRVLEDLLLRIHQRREVDIWNYSQLGYDVLSSQVATMLGITGPHAIVPTACAAGNYALGLACQLIRSGEADVVIAGGTDPLSHMIMSGFCRLKAVDSNVCRPFDLNRKGMMLGEGAGILVLEKLSHARARSAKIYAQVAGCGLSCDAFHMTAMDSEGKGLALAIERALAQSGVSIDDVDYINAHGTGTQTNDTVETEAIKRVFKNRATKIPVSSTKSMLGHAMGASSAIEAIVCVLVIERGAVPPNINYETPDPKCDLNIVANCARELSARVVLSNAAAFGGNNSCTVFKAVN